MGHVPNSLTRAGLAAVLLGLAVQSASADPGDLVVERQVGPRIAYRGLPVDSYPVTESVHTFPSQAFGASMDSLQSVTDSELASYAATGVGGVVDNALQPAMVGLLAGSGAAAGTLTPGGTLGGAFGGLAGGVGGTITGALGVLSTLPSMLGTAGAGK
ncbi:hypothetical protein PTE30175_01953 [Pandoraea terrae]|uniref:Uncharacterized protein n=1 Tax=Pandoraea terrae TaxID=1537710 RepID=A0A5E4UFQ5_9BURK|nr:hypothetical protein [Pandoraea terrae]VVD98865.1 hypothetical protein PTE30175_01953 [Pandoraea terrae]